MVLEMFLARKALVEINIFHFVGAIRNGMYIPHTLFYLHCKEWCHSIQEGNGKPALILAFSFLVAKLGRHVLTIPIIIFIIIIPFIFVIPFILG